MAAGKYPSKNLTGPYASWDQEDTQAIVVLANNSALQLGQPLCIDVTQLGPDQNIQAGKLAQAEYLVATTSGNAGPFWGCISDIPGAIPSAQGLTYTQQGPTGATVTQGGIPTWTNKTGASVNVIVKVRRSGFGYVLVGTAAIGSTGGNSILVGSTLVTTTAQVWGIKGTGAIASTIGYALGTAVNTVQIAGAAVAAAGVISALPASLVGIVPGSLYVLDSLASGNQESISAGSISYPTAAFAPANTHTAGYTITGPAANPAINSVLLSTPGAGVTIIGLVAALIVAE